MPVIVPLGRRITAVLDGGAHPATGEPISDSETCGSCTHWQLQVREDGSSSGHTKCTSPERTYRRGGPNLPPSTPACALRDPVPAVPGADALRVEYEGVGPS
jgi:hypothetical protein